MGCKITEKLCDISSFIGIIFSLANNQNANFSTGRTKVMSAKMMKYIYRAQDLAQKYQFEQ